MKSININVDFKDPEKEIQNELQRKGARNISIRKGYNGEIEVRYTIKADDPEKEITNILEKAGAQSVRASKSWSGGRFDFRIEDRLDEREFKRNISDLLRRSGYRTN